MYRCQKENHMKTECPEALVDCAFHEFGCVDKLKRKNEQSHYIDAACTHSHLKQIANNQTELKETVDLLLLRVDNMEHQMERKNWENRDIHQKMEATLLRV